MAESRNLFLTKRDKAVLVNGIGDITQSLFLSPSHPGAVIWGIGPV